MNAEDLFKQAFGGNFDFESMFGGEERQKAPSMSRVNWEKVSFNYIITLSSYKFSLLNS